MTRRKKIAIWAVVIVVLVGGFLALRISSWNQTYGLSKEVIDGGRTPTAEETIRLYCYYSNRRNEEKTQQLLEEQCSDMLWSSLLEDLKLLEIEDAGKWEHTEEIENAYQVWDYYVTYNQSILWASTKQTGSSECFRFTLVQEREGSPWKIHMIGRG